MILQEGDRVEHKNRGKGTVIEQQFFINETTVQFDVDSDAEGEILTVSTSLLKKIDD